MSKRIARNQGRIEYIACRETIETMRQQGYDKRKIHAALLEKRVVTMSYATFCYQCAHCRPIAPPALAPSQATIPKSISYGDNGFQSPKDVNPESLF